MTGPVFAVAIPAHDEAERIAACIAALAAQPRAADRIAGVIVYANNCRDDTAAIARACPAPFPLIVVEAEHPPERAHIGWARRGATDAAIARLTEIGRPDGIVAGTDADSRVATGWLAAMHAAFAAGADAVAGAIDIDPDDDASLGGVARRRDEAAYANAVARVAAHLDPLPHDPYPNHIWAWGANLAVRAPVLAAVGGIPLVDLAEDHALHRALLHHDARIRHTLDARVWTSGRSDGRAPGGFADLLTSYAVEPGALADFELEPAAIAWRRARLRGTARRLWQGGELAPLAARLGAEAATTFGAAWDSFCETCTLLQKSRVPVTALAAQTSLLNSRLTAIKPAAGDRSDTAASLHEIPVRQFHSAQP
ncbi:hypothetical protein GCM10011529_20430 [Polymorphobacter glacialis]|uniref:Glycosyltransferase 2-like domain-containing protein n=1 Tax=Sandarakinorhabdus glacialis TaxID=1614636 RepID=A0A916ZTY2_9SPHN|nr:glycosyltransferase [Polymorphobacter glacialis]GGE13935.1 hypothetical protein GCM10011529_20430 [Polymorphobacter glacialis]